MGQGGDVKLAAFTMELCTDIAFHLNHDHILRNDLGVIDTNHTSDGVHKVLTEWENTTSSRSFVIMEDGRAAGLISLSRIDRTRREASIGYWVFGEYRNRKVARRAFEALLRVARDQGVVTVKARIAKDNAASRRIWERYEHQSEPKGSMIEYCIVITGKE